MRPEIDRTAGEGQGGGMEQPSKYTSLVKRRLRADNRREQRLAMQADTVSLGAVIMAAMLAVTLGNSL